MGDFLAGNLDGKRRPGNPESLPVCLSVCPSDAPHPVSPSAVSPTPVFLPRKVSARPPGAPSESSRRTAGRKLLLRSMFSCRGTTDNFCCSSRSSCCCCSSCSCSVLLPGSHTLLGERTQTPSLRSQFALRLPSDTGERERGGLTPLRQLLLTSQGARVWWGGGVISSLSVTAEGKIDSPQPPTPTRTHTFVCQIIFRSL